MGYDRWYLLDVVGFRFSFDCFDYEHQQTLSDIRLAGSMEDEHGGKVCGSVQAPRCKKTDGLDIMRHPVCKTRCAVYCHGYESSGHFLDIFWKEVVDCSRS